MSLLSSGYNVVRGQVDKWRERMGPLSTTSTFRTTGELTADEFVRAGDYLVYKFPTWSWAPASSPAKTVAHLPADKQFLITRGVPCRRRLNENFAGDGEEHVVKGGEGFDNEGEGEEGWLSTGGVGREEKERMGDVRVVGDKGEADEGVADDDEDQIPDMDDEDDEGEAIIREPESKGSTSPLRTYTLYITYSRYYHTPRLYLSGYLSPSQPLPPKLMLEDIMGDYKDKTVTLEEFPFFDNPLQMASVHPCRHAAVMKLMLDRADAALHLRKERTRKEHSAGKVEGPEGDAMGLAQATKNLKLEARSGNGSSGTSGGDEWEVLQHGNHGGEDEDDEYAIRVDQYIVVFLKFIASVTPGLEHDLTMGI